MAKKAPVTHPDPSSHPQKRRKLATIAPKIDNERTATSTQDSQVPQPLSSSSSLAKSASVQIMPFPMEDRQTFRPPPVQGGYFDHLLAPVASRQQQPLSGPPSVQGGYFDHLLAPLPSRQQQPVPIPPPVESEQRLALQRQKPAIKTTLSAGQRCVGCGTTKLSTDYDWRLDYQVCSHCYAFFYRMQADLIKTAPVQKLHDERSLVQELHDDRSLVQEFYDGGSLGPRPTTCVACGKSRPFGEQSWKLDHQVCGSCHGIWSRLSVDLPKLLRVKELYDAAENFSTRPSLVTAQNNLQIPHTAQTDVHAFRQHPIKFAFWNHEQGEHTTLINSKSVLAGFVDLPEQGFYCHLANCEHQSFSLDGLATHVLEHHHSVDGYTYDLTFGCPFRWRNCPCRHLDGSAAALGKLTALGPIQSTFMYHLLLGHALTCHCGVPFAIPELLQLHRRNCTASLPVTHGLSLSSWWRQMLGKVWNHDLDEQFGWYLWHDMARSSTDKQLEKTSQATFDRLLDTTTKPWSIYVVRFSSKGRKLTKNFTRSLSSWNGQHMNAFGLSTTPLFLIVAIPSKFFPIVPSSPLSKLMRDLMSNPGRHEVKSFYFQSLIWAIRIAEAIDRHCQRFAPQKVCIASYSDGFSCCLELLCVFLLSIPSVWYDVKIQNDELRNTRDDLGVATYDLCIESMDNADPHVAHRRRVQDGQWLRLESLGLAGAIVDFLDDPNGITVRPYRVFLHAMSKLQQHKDGTLVRHRTDRLTHSMGGATVINYDGPDQFEERFEPSIKTDMLALAREALRGATGNQFVGSFASV